MSKQRAKDGTVYLRGRIYWASWYDEAGRRCVASTGETDEKEAAYKAKNYARGIELPKRPKVRGTLRDYAASFFTADCPRAQRLRDAGRPPGARWQRMQRAWLEHHVLDSKDPIGDMPLTRITRGAILDFRNRLRKRLPKHLNTVNKVVAVLATVLSEAAFREDIIANPAAKVGNVRGQRQERGCFTAEELATMFPGEGLGPWQDAEAYACFCLAAETGMRRGELLALKWKAVDFDAAEITVELAWKGPGQYGPPKNGKSRTFPLPTFSAARLAALRDRDLPPSEWVFRDVVGKPRGETWFQERFVVATAKLKIKARERRLSPHSFRHTLNSLLLASGADPMQVRAALGWSGSRIQESYLHLQASDLKAVTAKVAEVVRHPAEVHA